MTKYRINIIIKIATVIACFIPTLLLTNIIDDLSYNSIKNNLFVLMMGIIFTIYLAKESLITSTSEILVDDNKIILNDIFKSSIIYFKDIKEVNYKNGIMYIVMINRDVNKIKFGFDLNYKELKTKITNQNKSL